MPNWSSTAASCGIAGQWQSGMIVGRGATTAVSDLPAGHGLARSARSQRPIEECRDPRAALRGLRVTPRQVCRPQLSWADRAVFAALARLLSGFVDGIASSPGHDRAVAPGVGEAALDPAPRPTVGILPGHALDQHENSVINRRRTDVVGVRPLHGYQATMPAQDRARGDQSMDPQHPGQSSDQRGEHRSIGPVHPGLGVGPAQHGDFMTQHQQFDVLGRRRASSNSS